MAVFTPLTADQVAVWLEAFDLGTLLDLQGISSGITNTNYFVTVREGRFVLTLFEHHTLDDLQYFVELMRHLARFDVPCPKPVAQRSGCYLDTLRDKPALLVSCLSGEPVTQPDIRHCAHIGRMLGTMHVAGSSFQLHMQNPRGNHWTEVNGRELLPLLKGEAQQLLHGELAFQSQQQWGELPRGVIHADLFRDNVLFSQGHLTGLIDFYYACDDFLAYDLAITVNDWCVNDTGLMDEHRLQSVLSAYHAVRPLQEIERQAWPALLRAAALRFWVSRLYDFYHQKTGVFTHVKDPGHFQRILRGHIAGVARLWV